MLLTASPLFFFFWGASESGPYRGTVDLIAVVTPELALWASEVYTLFQGSLLRSERPLHIYFSTPLSLQPSPFFHLAFLGLFGLELNGRAGLPWLVFFWMTGRKSLLCTL